MAESTEQPRRLLLTTAVSRYLHAPEWDRPELIDAQQSIVSLFTETLGYEHVDVLGNNPTTNKLRQRLNTFIRSPERHEEDLIVVYISCHGEVVESTGEHVLLVGDTDPEDLNDPENTIATADLAKVLLDGTRVRNLLLLLDTCHSGQGARDLVAAAAQRMDRWWGRRSGGGFVMMHSAQPFEQAEAGAFPRLLIEAVDDISTAGHAPETIALGAVAAHINTNKSKPGHQTIGWDSVGLTGEPPPFLANPRHDTRLTEVDLALQQASLWDEHTQRRHTEFLNRFLVRAMADHRRAGSPGWWFEGRTKAISDIHIWLAGQDSPSTSPLLAVTANPGSGKTALLGLTAALSHPEHRLTVPLHTLGLVADEVPAVESVDVAIYAQRLSDQQVLDGIAAAAEVPSSTIGELLDGLGKRGYGEEQPFTVLIDALDEAMTPRTLCAHVLRPLIDHAAGRIRFLVGTRPFLLPHLGLKRQACIDLDDTRYADPQALRAYAVRNLLGAHQYSPYLHQPFEYVRAVAEAVSEASDTSFLVARIAASTLAASPTLPDPTDRQWRDNLPSHAGEAMATDLATRLGDEVQRAQDLLRPLAFAEGQGLPWEDIWAALASDISGRTYTDTDLHWLRNNAGSYVVEAVEFGRSTYRLYHQALVEHLCEGVDERVAHQAFHDVLTDRVPYSASGKRDWARAHPYALRYLSQHAVHAGWFDRVLTDPGLMAHASPDGLSPHLRRASSEEARLAAAVYRASIDVHRPLDAPQRERLLAVDAARYGAARLRQAHTVNASGYQPEWATGSGLPSPALITTLTGHTNWVRASAVTTLADGTPIAITTSDDGTVRLWDLNTHRSIGEPLTGHTGWVRAAAATAFPNGTPVAVTGGNDGTVRLWDLNTHRSIGEPLTGHTGWVRAAAATAFPNGTPVAVTGGNDGTVRLWDLNTHRSIGEPLTGHTDWVNAVATTTLPDGTPIAITSGSDGTIRLWDLHARQPIGEPLTGHISRVDAIATTKLPDGTPMAVTGGNDGTVRLWDLNTHRSIGEPLTGHTDWINSVATTTLPDGTPMAVTGGSHGTLRLWDLHNRQSIGEPLSGHTSQVNAIATATPAGGTPIAITTSDDHTIRLWDLHNHQPIGKPLTGHTSQVNAVATTTLPDGTPIAITGGSHAVRLWGLDNHQPIGKPLTGHTSRIRTIAVITFPGSAAIAITGDDGSVYLWDLHTHKPIEHPFKGHTGWANAISATTLPDGTPIAITTSDDHTVRLWDLHNHQPIGKPLTGHTSQVNAVATTTLPDGTPIAITGAGDNTIRLWDLDNHSALGDPLTGHTGRVDVIAATTLPDGTPIAITGAGDNTIRLWDLDNHSALGDPLTGHTGWVHAIAATTLPDGTPIAITGAGDNTIRLWDLSSRSCLDVIYFPDSISALALQGRDIVCACNKDFVVLRFSDSAPCAKFANFEQQEDFHLR
ncbi:WD40 repeat domain-containing protein [Nocardiopsis lambiniae]|uniref:WD40 repeat domain-containing protein n=1 Tax=Nocardiopsis lambiniae TaxID=3075539 RepID=A0ABU2MHB3_9ACTN|nr:WD40 repeat domain-containing protein [Nocardiopsis sp. DSM 44743]MDT0331445.1 WD40 repeat domain-containing protein [Nocardiopsis sp. DSM 44743]